MKDMEKLYRPTTNDELKKLVDELMQKHGNDVDLNCIDTGQVTDMSWIFGNKQFIGNISDWDVSNVTDTTCMFYGCPFNGDISKWDVSNVQNFSCMFHAAIEFNGDISKWNVSKAKYMMSMFNHAVSFNCDISEWNIPEDTNVSSMFSDCPDFPKNFMPGFKKRFKTHDGIDCYIRPASIGDSLFIAKGINARIDNVDIDELNKLVRQEGSLYDFRNVLIAEIDGNPVGCIVFYKGDDYKTKFCETWPMHPFVEQIKSGEFHIDTVYVLPEFQRQTIASHLIKMVIAIGNMKGLNKTSLLYDPQKEYLRDFYRSNAFVEEEIGGLHKKCIHNINIETKGDDLDISIEDFVRFKMVKVEGEKPFYMAETVVTECLWDKVMSNLNTTSKLPKNNITRTMAQSFIEKLSNNTGLEFRLPTLEEWQWAAKGGIKSKGYTFAGSDNLEEVAWCKYNSEDKVHAVAEKKPNELGLYDMSGNVWEMTSTVYYQPHASCRNRETQNLKVAPNKAKYCGGAFYDGRTACSSSNSGPDDIQWRTIGMGIRLVCDANVVQSNRYIYTI